MALLKQAASKGLSSAQFQLGRHYLYGMGIEKDVIMGYQYLLQASLNVASKSMDSRDLVSSGLNEEQIAQIQEETRNWQPKL